MRDVPKAEVAAYVHGAGLLPALVDAAASDQPWSVAAQSFLDVMFDPGLRAIDLDDPQYQAGVAALVQVGAISQANADEIEALYVAPVPWTFIAWGQSTPAPRTGFTYHQFTAQRGSEARGFVLKLPADADRDAALSAWMGMNND